MASINEYSTRYSLAIDAMQTTPPGEWRSQSETNRQGSGHNLSEDIGRGLSADEKRSHDSARDQYNQRIDSGVAREQARKDLPLSTYTEAYWKIDLHNLLHFLALRMDSHAQLEIRQYATTIGEKIVAKLFPVVWEAFLDYRMNSMSLTRLDISVINRLLNIGSAPPWSEITFLSVQDKSWAGHTRCRERDECLQKLRTLGLVADI
jgi:thymidylate synthase (FAD)